MGSAKTEYGTGSLSPGGKAPARPGKPETEEEQKAVEYFNEDGLVFSENYAETMNEKVLPWIREHGREISVSGAGGRPLHGVRVDTENARGTVLILHGFTENAEKFSELIHSLAKNGYSVLAYDQRGHGYSWRDGEVTDLSLTHVDSFEEYVQDLKAVCDQQLKEMPKPWSIFGHSMGGAVTCAFLEDYPEIFGKAVLCAPMIAPQRSGMPLWMGKALCRIEKRLGNGKKRIFISKPWSGPEKFEESCASGRERFDWYSALSEKTERYHNNGPSYAWTLEAFCVTERLLAPGKPEGVKIPVMLYTAESDNQVIPEAQEKITARMPSCTRKLVPGSKHEIYRSPDSVFFPWWHEILEFLK